MKTAFTLQYLVYACVLCWYPLQAETEPSLENLVERSKKINQQQKSIKEEIELTQTTLQQVKDRLVELKLSPDNNQVSAHLMERLQHLREESWEDLAHLDQKQAALSTELSKLRHQIRAMQRPNIDGAFGFTFGESIPKQIDFNGSPRKTVMASDGSTLRVHPPKPLFENRQGHYQVTVTPASQRIYRITASFEIDSPQNVPNQAYLVYERILQLITEKYKIRLQARSGAGRLNEYSDEARVIRIQMNNASKAKGIWIEYLAKDIQQEANKETVNTNIGKINDAAL